MSASQPIEETQVNKNLKQEAKEEQTEKKPRKI